jgi:spermidine/putrescine transport system ATP-binding protein
VSSSESSGAVELRQLTKTYPGAPTPTLADLSLQIADGEFFSLVGPSGSGKTTTLRLLAGFESPDSGTVLLGGHDVTRVPPYRRSVNTVFQNYALFPHMSVAKNVEYPLKMMGRSERSSRTEAARAALDLVGMGTFATRLPHELSGGQRQRVALARALVSQPKVVLLDEPLGALDLQLRHQMQVVLKDLHSQLGITFIYVTHDQGEALAMSDRIAVMNLGRIEQCGTPQDIYCHPRTRFVAGFIGRSNLLDVSITDGVIDWHGTRLFTSDAGAGNRTTTVAIRTEAIRVVDHHQRGRADNTFEATVRQEVFLGDAYEVVLVVDDGELIAKVPSHQITSCTPGQRVCVSIAPADLRVVDA